MKFSPIRWLDLILFNMVKCSQIYYIIRITYSKYEKIYQNNFINAETSLFRLSCAPFLKEGI